MAQNRGSATSIDTEVGTKSRIHDFLERRSGRRCKVFIMKKVFWLVVLTVTFILGSQARAFGITPARYLVTVNPGESQTLVMTIDNNEPKPVNFSLSITGMRQDSAGRSVFTAGLDPAETWVKPEAQSVTLRSGEKRKIRFTVSVPKDALPGSRYLGLAIESIPARNGETIVNGRLTALLILQIAGVVTESLSLESHAPTNFIWKKNLPFTLKFTNNGTIETPVSGQVITKNWRGRALDIQPLVLGNQLIAGTKRSIDTALAAQKIFWPGLYAADIQIRYGKTNQKISSTIHFWYLPRDAAVTVGLLIILLLILKFRRRKK